MDEDERRTGRAGRAIVATLAAVALAAVVLAGCGKETTSDTGGGTATAPTSKNGYLNEIRSDGQPTVGGSLVYALPEDTNSWNPALAQWASYSFIEARSMFDFLAGFDENGKIKPDLALSFEHNADYTQWTIKIPKGITFHNGKPLTASSLVERDKYIKASPILGEALMYIDSWDVVDDQTYVVHTNQPFATYPEGMTSQVGAVADPDWLKQNDGINAVGTGPFKLEKWDVGKQMSLVKNPNYWRKDTWGNTFPYLDRLTFDIVRDDATRANALRSGDADIIQQNIASPDMVELRKMGERGEAQVFTDKAFETAEDHVVLNTTAPPFDDVDARRALAYATDQQHYLSAITNDLNAPATSAYDQGSPWHTDVTYPTYDPEKAKQLVEQVKARHGGEFAFEIMAQSTPETIRIQQELQRQWEAVGIKVTSVTADQQAKIIRTLIGDYQATIQQLFDSPAPDNDCVFWRSSGKPSGTPTLNFSRLNDPRLLELCKKMSETNDPELKRSELGELQQRLADQVPYVWLAHVSRMIAASPKVVNVVHRTLPDGSTALDFTQGSHTTYQIWLKS